MADIRIKDLGTTASVTASDDFMAVDGTTNGTRKLSAATPAFLTSVTTPSLTSPAATALTLGTGSFGTALTVASATGAATFSGAVSISSTTAGAANAGALVLQGGISAGNTGSAASYFGGAVTVAGTLTNTAAQLGAFTSTTSNPESGEGVFSIIGANTNTDIAYGINRAPGIAIQNTSGTANSYGGLVFMDAGGNTTSSILGIFENDANNTGSLKFNTRPSGGSPTTALTLASTGAATFAGAVSITGNVGFYGQAATAKPTGVAVTAAAIHAALVTLNLIAA